MSARRHLTVAGLLAPAVVLLVLFFAIPSIDLFRLSLAHMDAQRAIHHDVSLVNYKNFATNPYFHRMVWGSVKLTVAVTALCLLLGYPAAYFMVRVRSTLSRTILYAIVVSPLLISVIVRSYGWVVLLANNGVINGTLLSLDGNLGRNTGVSPWTVFDDLRVAKRIHFGERWNMDLIADMFNLANRYNVSAVSPLFTNAGQATAAYDPRQFQFAMKLNW